MSEVDVSAIWMSATCMAELGELTAQWLEGSFQSSPWQFGPPDDETAELVEILARLNRNGFVTEHSQPARGPDTDGSAQRATVSGFCDDDLSILIEEASCASDLIVVTFGGEPDKLVSIPYTIPITSTREDGALRPFTWAGGAADLFELFPKCLPAETTLDDGTVGRLEAVDPQIVYELAESPQVTLVDPVWGRRDELWSFLSDVLDIWTGSRDQSVTSPGS